MQAPPRLRARDSMPDLLVRNVPEHIMLRLKQQARRNHRSVQKEALEILEEGTQLTMEEWLRLADSIREESKSWGLLDDSTDLIREDRDSR